MVDINLYSQTIEIDSDGIDTITVSPSRTELQGSQLLVLNARETVVELTGRGAQGPPGPPGASGGAFIHDQAVASDQWVVVHGFGRSVNVEVYDETGCVVRAAVVEISPNIVEVRANKPFIGRAVVL